ncbi:MAG: hypothetical protein JWO80_4971 [Bryobacterales bacterium]|nr:hypothetical protein [Bryobacterales bacterium]
MKRTLLLLSIAAWAAAADDPWAKVRDIKSGSEIRVYKKGSKQPIIGKFDQATEDSVVVMLKKEDTSIVREDVDRIDSRPDQKGSRVTTNSTTKTDDGSPKLPPLGPHRNDERPETSTSSGLSVNSRPGFETVYTRPVSASSSR